MKKIVIIYYSRSGNTAEMAKLIAEGARSVDGVHTDIFSVADIDAKKMLEYDGIILGSPTYYGSMAYEIKKLIDDIMNGKREWTLEEIIKEAELITEEYKTEEALKKELK
ncbi:MAG TPA: flavodoxin domain-containing protein, partial [Candidatus Omnitrophota bacterium]|nr:flavodoxin domain-containing protein [Candidatus Omnitrophota bacterium]